MSRRFVDALPEALAVVAEGAWIAALYAVVQAAARGPMPLGPIPLALAAASGLVLARRLAPRLGGQWPRTALGLVAMAAIVGCLAEPSALAALAALDPGAALRAHPGGLLAALAFLRGMAYAAPAGSDLVLERLLDLGLPGLAIPVLVTGALQEPWRDIALGRELVACAIFLVSATLGVAIGRVAGIAHTTGFDWHRNRAWLLLVGLLAVGIVAATIPASLAVGPVIRITLAAIVAPVIFLGAIAGVSQVRLRQALALLLLLGWLLLLAVFATGRIPPPDAAERPGFGGTTTPDSPIVNAAGGALVVLILVIGILILARLWMREAIRRPDADVAEERTIDRGSEVVDVLRGPRRRRRAPWPAPVDATGAYLALLREIEARPEVRRAAGESPAEHARRLRAEGRGRVSLDLLAADYELARFAGRRLTPAEERRAVARWGRLRRTLGIDTGRTAADGRAD